MKKIKNNKREIIQKEITKTIINNDFIGIVNVSPRLGKSKCIIDSVESKLQWDIVISSPNTSVKQSWINEISEWNPNFEPNLICHKSLSKISGELDLLIIDEIHLLSENQILQIIMKRPKRILGLSGTINYETYINLNKRLNLKKIYNYSFEQAIEDEIISNFEIKVILCDFNNNVKNITSGTKKYPKIVTEKEHYDYLTKQFEKFRSLRQMGDYSLDHLREYYYRERKNLIYKSNTKIKITKKIIGDLSNCLIFTSYTEQADLLSSYSYHSKNKKDNNLDKFDKGEINKLGVCGMVDVGVTLKNLKNIVVHQLQSNSEAAIQKFLRACNLDDDRNKAKIYIVCFNNSIDKEWTDSAIENIPKDKIEYYNWNNVELSNLVT